MDDEFLQEALSHLDMLYNLARRMTSSAHDAEDVVQETYARALQGWRRKPPQHPAAWLATICINTARSQHRRRRARPEEVLRADPEFERSTSDTATQAIERLEAETVHRALEQLPSEQREAIVLMDLCGFTASQVAQLNNVPRGTVLSRVHRGHKRLADILERVTRFDP